MSRLWGELYCVSLVGHVSGEELYECVIWNEFISSSSMSGCNTSWLLCGCMIFGSFLGSMVIHLCNSHSTSVSKSCGGGCRKLVRCGRLL